MKVDYKSFQDKYGEVKKHLSKEVIDAVESTLPIWDMYDDAEFRPSIDDVIELVNGEIANIKEEGEKTVKKTEKPKEKPAKQQNAKFKVGEKVVTDHSSNVYTIVEINEKGQYKLDTTSGWWAESQLSKPKKQPKPKKEPKAKKAKQQKAKFKVGQYVANTHTNPYTIGIIDSFDDVMGEYSYHFSGYVVDKSNGVTIKKESIDALEKNLRKATKKEFEKAQKAYIESQKTPVASLPIEVTLLKKYVGMHGKKLSELKTSRTYNPESLLRSIQRAIEEKRIRKESKYADEIRTIQKELIRLLRDVDAKKVKGSDTIEISSYEKCKAIVDSMRVDETTKISKSFISKVQEREGKKKDAENILAKLKELKADEDNKEIVSAMEKAIENYINGKTDKVEAVERQLRGVLGSVAKKGCNGLGSVENPFDGKENDSTIASTDLLNVVFDTLSFDGRWESFFGNPSRNFHCMIYGKAGSGKSTFAIQFAKYLSKVLGLKVLYIASEERFGYTLQEKIRRFNVANDNISFAEKLPLDITKYDVVFFDSVTNMRIEPEEWAKMTANIASVGIFQCTKDGAFRGGADFEHDVDIVVNVENMVATIEKNRFKVGGLQFAVR